MQGYTSPSERLKALTDQLEQGVSDIFQSGQYAAYLTAMSKFHHYSFGNITVWERSGGGIIPPSDRWRGYENSPPTAAATPMSPGCRPRVCRWN